MFLSHIFVWFWSRLAGFGQILSMNVSVLRHQPQHHAQQLGNLFPEQQSRQQRLEGGVHIGTVDTSGFGQIGAVVGAQGGQSLQVDVLSGVYVTGKKGASDFLQNMRIIFDEDLPRWSYMRMIDAQDEALPVSAWFSIGALDASNSHFIVLVPEGFPRFLGQFDARHQSATQQWLADWPSKRR